MWNQVNAVLQESESILSGLQAYKGAGQEIRDVGRTRALVTNSNILKVNPWVWCFFSPPPQAIQNPNDFLLQEKAWNSVCPLVIRLKKFYGFSLKLGNALPYSSHILLSFKMKHVSWIFSFLWCRESPAEPVGVSDLPTLHSNSASGEGAGPRQAVRRDPAFHTPLR